jgi:type II restriction/modification system DNA methylase subunit YeeA
MQSTLEFRTNRDLFSNHYLTEHLPETEQWQEVLNEDVESVYENVRELWESEQDLVSGYNEASLQNNFIDPVLEELGITFEIEETVERNARRPDYAFFADADARTAAFEHRDEGGDFYEEAIAVADVKRWGRKLDTRGEGERDFENPSYQIHVYLQETPAQWAVLTNGRKWRLYYGPTSHRLDSYYEIDLPTLLEQGGVEEFRYFYLFFRRDAFVEDSGGDCFLDDVYDESNTFAEALGEDLQDNIYDAIGVLAEGFLEYNADLGEDDLDLIHDSSLIYLYRLIFVLYAESEGRELLPTDNDIYSESYSLNELKQTVAENLDDSQEHYYSFQTDLSDNLDELFDLINKGSNSRNIDPDLLFIPAYNGGLFRTDPEEDDSDEANFLASHEVDDEHLAEVIDLLTRRNAENGAGKVFTDYSSLDIRHLGSIYEGLLEYQLTVADDPLTLDDGEYSTAEESDKVIVESGDVYMTTDSGERKATGSYYTPEYVVEYIVENTLEPLVSDIREDLMARSARGDRGFAEEFAQEVFGLKILDPAMGSGHFLTNAVDYLAREIINAQERQAEQQGVESIDRSHDINWARRQVAQRCIYGVDLNPLAVELSKVSLWLRTLAAEQPLAFLDHHLKTGNSLVGSDIEDVLSNGESDTDNGQLTLQQSFAQTRRQALEHIMDRFQDLLSIDNESLEDIKEMEAAFEEVRDDPLYQRLLSMANVHTAEEFGLDVPSDVYERMAEALRDDSWEDIEGQDWFESAQTMAEEERFFHWELEFPVAYYSESGDRTENAGFNAVIGNPPYVRVQRIHNAVADYLFDQYQTCAKKTDLSVPFLELAVDLISDDGVAGYISTSQWVSTDYGEAARQFLGEGHISRMIDFGTLPVFEGISTYPAIFILDAKECETLQYAEVPSKQDLNSSSLRSLEIRELEYDRFGGESWVLEGLDLRETLTRHDVTEPLSEWGHFNIGAITGMDDVFVVTEDEIKDRGLERDLIYPHAHRGEEISKFGVVNPKEKVIYPYEPDDDGNAVLLPEEHLERKYPNIHTYFESHKPDLRERRDSRKYYADGPDWYCFLRQGHYDYIEAPKLLARGVAQESCVGLLEAGSIFSGNNCPGFVPADNILGDVTYLLALLNSTLISGYLQQVCPAKMQGYIRLNAGDLNSVPVRVIEFDTPQDERDELVGKAEGLYHQHMANGTNDNHAICDFVSKQIDDGREEVAHDLITNIVDEMTSYVRKRESLNTALLNYLGNYADGPALPDVGLFHPTDSSILDATTEEYEKLRVGDVKTERDGNHVTLYATARYKPENEGEHETDQYGYTETDYEEAFALTDLSEKEAALVESFVPVAVEEADRFAVFRDNATKNNSPIDRLKAITLPEPKDVEDDLRRYLDVKERAEELDERIEKTDRLIDEIVYELYDLTQEEIEVVESNVTDD